MAGRDIPVSGQSGLGWFEQDNPANMQLTGSNLQEQKTEADVSGGTLTFSDTIQTVEIFNTDDVNTGVFIVNGITIKVPPGKVFKSGIGGVPDANITVSGATTYIVSRYV